MTPHESRSTRLPALRLAAGLLFLATALSGCDNPACIFGGNCNTGGGGSGSGLGSLPATFPEDDQWVSSGAPALQEVLPSGSGVSATSPIVLRFSESMAASTLAGAFELFQIGGSFGDQPVPLAPPAVTGDGRLVVLFPAVPLALDSDFELRASDTAQVSDLDGTRIPFTSGQVLGTMRTEATASSALRLVASYPPGGSASQSRTTEVVAVLDRAVDPASISPASFAVTVDGVPPAFNPLATRLLVQTGGGNTAAEGRVLTWKSVDTSSGKSQDLGSGGSVQVSLSPAGAPLTPLGGGQAMTPTTWNFTLATFMAPVTIALQSASGIGLGIDDLTGATPYTVDLTFVDAQAGDVVELFLFGLDPAGVRDIALLRSKTLSGAVAADTWTAAEVALAPAAAPPQPVLSDGFVAFAFRVVRGGVGSPVRVLDVDASQTGIQDPVLDTVPPALTGFGPTGGSATVLRSTVRDLVVTGLANEPIAFADVDAGVLGTNGTAPVAVAGGAADGTFIARRLPLTTGPDPGLLDAATSQAGAPFTLTVYDRVHNAGAPVTGTFFQVGASGPGSALPAAPIDVEVRSAATLAALSGARVFVHDLGTGLEFDSATTSASGQAQVAAAPGGSVVTVELSGFDVFTMQSVPTSRLSVLLPPAGAQAGIASGVVSSTNPALDALTRFHADSRRAPADEPLLGLLTCSSNVLTGTTDCPFGPTSLRPYQLGATSILGVVTPPDATSFSPAGFLRAFLLDLPRPHLAPGQIDNETLSIAHLLDEPGVPAAELPLDGPDVTWNDTLASSDGVPRALVEARVHGLASPAVVGAAAAFDQGGGTFRVRSAVPGIAAGALVTQDVLDAQFLLRLESRDATGNRAASRPAFDPNAAPLTGSFSPPALPTITSPPQGGTASGPSFTVDFDAVMGSGIYRLTLTGANGRVWRLFVPDPGAATTVTALVPDLAGASPLGTGTVFATTTAWQIAGFDPGLMLFTDPDLRYDRLSERIGHSFTLQ